MTFKSILNNSNIKFLSKNAIYTVLDQATISIVNFFIGIVFIYFSSPDQYGLYVFTMSFFYFFSNVQNSLINTPVIVLTPRMESEESERFKKGINALILPLYILVVILFFGYIYFFDEEISIFFILIGAISICSLLLRDYYRSQEFANLNPAKAFKRDFGYTIISILFIVILIYLRSVTSTLVIVATGLASLLVSGRLIIKDRKSFISGKFVKESFKKSWLYSKWSFLGATSSWVKTDSYVYVPFIILGTKEIAYLAAAKLLMTPINLIIRSWSNFYRPLMSKVLHKGKLKEAKKLLLIGIVIILFILLIYTLLIILLLNIIPLSMIPNEYVGIEKYVYLWAVVIILQTFQSNFSSFLQASLEFKKLAILGFIAAIFTLIISIIFVYIFGSIGAIISLISGEALSAVLLGLYLMKMFKIRKLDKQTE